MSSPANFVTNDILRFRKGALLSSYIHLMLTFFFSGLMHACSDISQSISWQHSGAVRFFCTQAIGIMVEDCAQTTVRLLTSSNRKKAPSLQHTPIAKILGFAWVLVFLIWSTPVWIYPSLYANKGEEKDIVVPFSLIGAAREIFDRT